MALSKAFANDEVLSAEDTNTHLVNHVPAPGATYDTGWVTVPWSTGFSTGADRPLQVRRIGLWIEVRGCVNGVGGSGNHMVGVIPEAFRPDQPRFFYPMPTLAPNVPAGRSFVNSNGQVTINSGPGGSAAQDINLTYSVGAQA